VNVALASLPLFEGKVASGDDDNTIVGNFLSQDSFASLQSQTVPEMVVTAATAATADPALSSAPQDLGPNFPSG
jgi:hypothetical protein